MAPRKEGAVQRTGSRSGVRLVRPDRMEERIREAFDAVARRAFEIFERTGNRAGHERENWFRAEAELFHPAHVEIAEADSVLTVKAEVPGFAEKDLEVSLEPRRITITGKRETKTETRKNQTLYSEQCANEIFRVVDLPREVDLTARGIKATYDHGVLTIALPEAKGAKTRHIKIEPKSSAA